MNSFPRKTSISTRKARRHTRETERRNVPRDIPRDVPRDGDPERLIKDN